MMAGYNSATAVPDVVITSVGVLDDLASPNAKNPDERSSTIGKILKNLLREKASVRGVLLEPGEIQTFLMPHSAM